MSDYLAREKKLQNGLRETSNAFVDDVTNQLTIKPGDPKEIIEAKLDAMERIQQWMSNLRATLLNAIREALEWVKNKIAEVPKKIRDFFSKIFKKLFSDNS